MANGSINLVNLDFENLKTSLKNYLSSQSQFADYDFEGSNINVLLDLLSYNTYMNSFYLNMVASEMFLDSAQLRDSIISHAKELNYLPRSFRSARAAINLTITPSDPTISTVTLSRGTSFTSKVGSNTFTFSVPDNIVLTSTSGVFTANSLDIYEGSFVTDVYIYNSSAERQRFIVSNPTIDTTSLRLYVTEDNGSQVHIYEQRTSYLNVTPSSKVFFLQASENDTYEIIFGNGTFGRRPKDSAVISAVYRVCNGELPNGCALFSADSSIDGHSNVSVSTVESAYGGMVHETSQSIKTNATRFFQTQERAVTASDYKTLLQLNFPEIISSSVYGGESVVPPQYGKVVVSLNISGQDKASDSQKNVYRDFLKEVTPLSIDPVFIDPEFLNVEVESHVKYNLNTTSLSNEDVVSLAKTKIRLYNETNLNRFSVKLRLSNLSTDIDSIDNSILSNQTSLRVYKDIIPNTSRDFLNTFVIKFNNQLLSPTHFSTNALTGEPNHIIQSSSFDFEGTEGERSRCIFEDDGRGKINIVLFGDPTHPIVTRNVGTVDYSTGIVTINKVKIPYFYGNSVKVFAKLNVSDPEGKFNDILRIRDGDIIVRAIGERV